jgi:Spy/CpxP family protein refolding chaperone
MKTKWFTITALALSLGASFCMLTAKAYAAPLGSPAPGYQEGGGRWDEPPAEFREVQRQGFHDGIEGARKDFNNHREPNVENREEFRHPHVERSMREDYREGFRRGYEKAMHHMAEERDHHDHDHDHD